MSIVIGLHGAKGSGKDQFFKAVERAFPLHPVKKIAYADPIKHEVQRIFELQDEQQYDLFKRTNVGYQLPGYLNHAVDGRRVVREIGMLMRKYDESQFTSYVEKAIESHPGSIWCITDLRFANEYESIRKVLGGKVVKILRTGYVYDGHATETEFSDSDCDYIIHNDGDLRKYKNKVVDVMNDILTF